MKPELVNNNNNKFRIWPYLVTGFGLNTKVWDNHRTEDENKNFKYYEQSNGNGLENF